MHILRSLSHNIYYYGSTSSLDKRIKDHNKGRVKFTKGRRPWMLHYFEEFSNRSEAFKREKFFKSIEGYNYLKGENII